MRAVGMGAAMGVQGRAMTDKILRYMEEYHMLPENGNVVAGVSGGADSVCLLLVLLRLRESLGLNLHVVHVNHGLRQEAGEDARFVEALCKERGVSFSLVEEDVEGFARRERLSCEEAGRTVRYRAFAQALDELDRGNAVSPAGLDRENAVRLSGEDRGSAAGPGGDAQEDAFGRGCIAVAHNSDDRAETLLFHLLRGTGLSGMGSIRPVRENADGSRIIRPLLCCTRQEIEAFLKTEGVSFRTDATNAETVYTRNKIRNRLLPYAEREICVGAKGHLAREAALLSDTADFVEKMTKEALQRCAGKGDKEGAVCMDIEAFLGEEPFLQDQMLWQAVRRLGAQKDLTAAHVAELKKLFSPGCQSGRRVVLPLLRLCARREFGCVILEGISEKTAGNAGRQAAVTVVAPGKKEVPSCVWVPGLGRVEARILPGPGADNAASDKEISSFFKNIPEKKYTKWLNYDNIIESAVFRTRLGGDYLTINDAMGKKSLKRYLIEERIPAAMRDTLMLLADGQHIIWVPGHRISAAYKVTGQTKAVLFLRCAEKEPETYSGGGVLNG